MVQRNARRTYMLIAVLVAFALFPLLPTLSVSAFTSGRKWSQRAFMTVPYQIDPGLDQKLGNGVVNTQQHVRNAALAWNKASNLNFLFVPGYDENAADATYVTAKDIAPGGDPYFCNFYANAWATACWNPGGPEITRGALVLNNTQRPQWNPMRWNTTGWVQPLNGLRNADVYNLSLHEFGHWQYLADNPPNHPEAVMNFQETAKPNLTDDVKHGATMLYGPYTSFEAGEAQWRGTNANGIAYGFNTSNSFIAPIGVDNINGSGYYLYPRSGQGQLRILGTANAGYSYSYHKLFTYEDDSNPDIVQNRSYVTITNGMFLHWCQASMSQSTMSIDFFMDNGVNFRDALRSNGDLFRDTLGVPVHPALRGSYPTAQWLCHQVDLSDLAGRKIIRWMVTYDNGNNGVTGEYRAYFDNLQLVQQNLQGNVGIVGSGSVSASPPGPYAPNTPVTFTANPSAGWVFTGWTINSYREGWPNPLTATVDGRFTLVANFAQQGSFPDVPTSSGYYQAIRQMAARGIIRGYVNGNFGPNDAVQRAQAAAFIARAIPSSTIPSGTWDSENWGNPFSDSGGIDPNLWRNVGTLHHYGVANGYDSAGCAARGVAYPCFGPTDQVLEVQVIAFISRAMVTKGYWAWRPATCSNYSGVTTARQEICTYVHYAGGIAFSQSDGYRVGTRGWFAQQWWQALDSYFSVDRIP